MAKRKKPAEGDVVEVELADGTFAYGRVRHDPYVSFYALPPRPERRAVDEVLAAPVAFTVGVYDHAWKNPRWRLVGHAPLEPAMRQPIYNFLQDPVNLARCRIIDDQGEERPATIEECEGLERCAVWDDAHVESRLADHFAVRPNVWLESMKLRRPTTAR